MVTEETKGSIQAAAQKNNHKYHGQLRSRFVWQYSMIVVAMSSDVLQTIILRSYLVVGLQKSQYHNKVFIN